MAVESSTKISLGKGGEFRSASTVSTGNVLGTTAVFIPLPYQTERVIITPTTFSTAVSVSVAVNPWLVVLKTTDNMGNLADYSKAAQDASTSTLVDVSALNTRANGDFLLVGSHIPFRGVYFDVHGLNAAGTATVSVYYWNGSAWVDTSATVTGIRTTMVWDKDGIVTWTVPAAWKPESIKELYPSFTTPKYFYEPKLYWTRWEVDAALADTDVTFYSMSAANRSTAYAELISGQSLSKNMYHGFGGEGCVEALANAASAYVHVNAYTSGKFE